MCGTTKCSSNHFHSLTAHYPTFSPLSPQYHNLPLLLLLFSVGVGAISASSSAVAALKPHHPLRLPHHLAEPLIKQLRARMRRLKLPRSVRRVISSFRAAASLVNSTFTFASTTTVVAVLARVEGGTLLASTSASDGVFIRSGSSVLSLVSEFVLRLRHVSGRFRCS